MALTAEFVTGRNVSFQRVRRMLATQAHQAGVINPADFNPTERAAGGPNMSVDVQIGDAWINVVTGGLGLVHARSDALENRAIAASNATNPRVDAVVLQYNDSSLPAGVGGDDPTIRVVTGTPVAGATLDNRNGAPGGAGGPGFPGDCLHIADVLVPASSTTVVNANIRDRRRWARGLHYVKRLTTGSNITTSSIVLVSVDAALVNRVECSGVPLEVDLIASPFTSSTNNTLEWALSIDGAEFANTKRRSAGAFAAANGSAAPSRWPITPPAGSRLIGPLWSVGSGSGTILSTGGYEVVVTYRETPAANEHNG